MDIETLKSLLWKDGKKNQYKFDEVLKWIKEHEKIIGELHIGSDSHIIGKNAIFATAICILCHNKERKYFFVKNKMSKIKMNKLFYRLNAEVMLSLIVSLEIKALALPSPQFVHIDCNSNPKYKSEKYKGILINMIKAHGFKVKIKPDSWASFAVADRHAK